ncbi:MAG: hypothetical protein ACI8UP_004981, partial [Porticoccaceae bacterium]
KIQQRRQILRQSPNHRYWALAIQGYSFFILQRRKRRFASISVYCKCMVATECRLQICLNNPVPISVAIRLILFELNKYLMFTVA